MKLVGWFVAGLMLGIGVGAFGLYLLLVAGFSGDPEWTPEPPQPRD